MGPCWRDIGDGGDRRCPKLAGFVLCRNCPEFARTGRHLLDREPPDGRRREWAEEFAARASEQVAAALAVVVFRIHGEWLALETVIFQEVVAARPAHSIPGRSGGAFIGLANVNGELLLCFSAAGLLGISGASVEPGAGAGAGRMLVLSRNGERLVMAVDEVLGVRRVPVAGLEPLPATLLHSPETVTKAVFSLSAPAKDTKVGLLDGDRLFRCAERILPC